MAVATPPLGGAGFFARGQTIGGSSAFSGSGPVPEPASDPSHGQRVGSTDERTGFDRLRLAAEPKDRFAVVRLRFETRQDLPLKVLSRSHPEIVVNMTAIQPLSSDRSIVEFEVTSTTAQDLTDEIAREPGVVSATLMTPVGPRSRYQMTINTPPEYILLARQLGALLRYPRIVRGGVHTVEVAATSSQIRQLIEELRKITHSLEVLRFGTAHMTTCPTSLTPREYALLHRALADGYFDVPRGVTLTTFAAQLGRSKSAVSRALAVIERKLAEASVTTPG